MTSTIAFHRAPAAGFDAPFEMLAACHERVARMLDLLGRLGVHLEANGADGQAADAARDVLRYFDVAGPAHHEDEERHVLPWLAAHGAADLARRLHDEHRQMARDWTVLRADLLAVTRRDWPAGRAAPPHWAAFARRYEAHIALEDGQAYPPVARASDAAALAAMGREMAARRGVVPDLTPGKPGAAGPR